MVEGCDVRQAQLLYGLSPLLERADVCAELGLGEYNADFHMILSRYAAHRAVDSHVHLTPYRFNSRLLRFVDGRDVLALEPAHQASRLNSLIAVWPRMARALSSPTMSTTVFIAARL